jgi:hypothetical protein
VVQTKQLAESHRIGFGLLHQAALIEWRQFDFCSGSTIVRRNLGSLYHLSGKSGFGEKVADFFGGIYSIYRTIKKDPAKHIGHGHQPDSHQALCRCREMGLFKYPLNRQRMFIAELYTG